MRLFRNFSLLRLVSIQNDVLYLNKEEYELLRSILLDGRCSGVPIATWRKEHEICDPPPWSELVASPCCGSCHHFLLLMSVDSWLGFVKTTALVKYPGTIEDSFFDKLQQIHDLIYCKEHTRSYKASTVRVKRRVTLLFLNHLENNKFKASSKPPVGVPCEPLERLIHNAKSRQDFDTASLECRKRQVIPEASMSLMKRREVLLDRKAGTPSQDGVVDIEASTDKLADKKCSDAQGGPNQEYWQVCTSVHVFNMYVHTYVPISMYSMYYHNSIHNMCNIHAYLHIASKFS